MRNCKETRYEKIYGLVDHDKRFATHSYPLATAAEFGTGEDETIEKQEHVRRHAGGTPLLTDLNLATGPLHQR